MAWEKCWMSTLRYRTDKGPRAGNVIALIEPLESRRLMSANASPMALALESSGANSSEPIAHVRAARAISWIEAAPSPIPRFESAGEVVGGKLYVFGGF